MVLHFMYLGKDRILAHSRSERIRNSEVNSVCDRVQIRSNTISAVMLLKKVSQNVSVIPVCKWVILLWQSQHLLPRSISITVVS